MSAQLKTPLQLIAAARKPQLKETRIQSCFEQLLLQLGAQAEREQTILRRAADLHITGRNIVFELKATGKLGPDKPGAKVGETQLGQVQDYVRTLRADVQSHRRRQGQPDDDWFGTLTDGVSGFVYVWHPGCEEPEEIDSWGAHDSDQAVLDKISNLLEQAPKNKTWAPIDLYAEFRPFEEEFHALYKAQKWNPGLRTKFTLWKQRVEASGLVTTEATSQEELFVKHCFLVAVAKAVICSLQNRPPQADNYGGLNDGFTSWLFENRKHINAVNKLFQKADRYEWVMHHGDVLRTLYEQCIEKDDRKLYGEYYTPDWLAEQLTEQLLDSEWIETAANASLAAIAGNPRALDGIGVLDPTCGSGTFLYHAANRIRQATALRDAEPELQARAVLNLVHGLDIHPVAVEMAKATLLRALPVAPSGVELNVSQADSLLIDRTPGSNQNDMLDDILIIKTAENSFMEPPEDLISHPSAASIISLLVDAAVAQKPMPKSIPTRLRSKLSKFYRQLQSTYEREGNGVWKWHIQSAVHPWRLKRRKINRILANPPWVVARDIQVPERKQEIERFARNTAQLWPGGRNAASFDIAAIFIKRCRELYLTEDGHAVWLTNAAALRTDTWQPFREYHEKHCSRRIDYRKVKRPPFKGAHTCALFEQGPADGTHDYEAVNVGAEKIFFTHPWSVVKSRLQINPLPTPPPEEPSDYRGEFRRGADLYPHCLVRVDHHQPATAASLDVTTHRSQQRPWADVPCQSGRIPKRWLHTVISHENLLPFIITDEDNHAIVPLTKTFELESNPFQNEFWQTADAIYRNNQAKGQSTPKTLLANLNHHNKLTKQLERLQKPVVRRLVVYNTSGDYLRSSRSSSMIVETKCYHYLAPSQREAAYLVALLNAEVLQYAYRQAKHSDRDFHTHIWNAVPIPKFDPNDPLHLAVANVTPKCERVVAKIHAHGKRRGATHATHYSNMRVALSEAGLTQHLDQLAAELLPNHARSTNRRSL